LSGNRFIGALHFSIMGNSRAIRINGSDARPAAATQRGGIVNGSDEEARYGGYQIQTQAKEHYEEESHQENH